MSPPSATAPPHRPVAGIAVILAILGTAISALGSWIPSFWGDEAASVMSAERPWSSLFRMFGNVDAVHGTYYVFLHLWVDLFGASAFSVRFPSAVAIGVATAGLVVLGNRLAGRRVAVLAGLVFVILPGMTEMGAEARSYSLTAACATWLTVLLVRLIRTRSTRRLAWIGYATLYALAIYLFLYLALLAVVHAVILLSVSRIRVAAERRFLRLWSVAIGGGLLLASPVIVFGIAQHRQIAWIERRAPMTLDTFFVAQWFQSGWFALAAWALIATTTAVAATAWRRRRRLVRGAETGEAGVGEAARMPALVVVAGAWFAVPPLLLLLANLTVAPLYTIRYTSFVAPAIALLIAAAISALERRWATRMHLVSAIAVISLAALAAPTYLAQRGPYSKDGGSDWAQVASTIGENARAGDAVIFGPGRIPSRDPRLAMHLYPESFRGLVDVTLRVPYAEGAWLGDAKTSIPAAADRLARTDGRVWLIRYEGEQRTADTTQLAELKQQGYSVVRTVDEHRDRIFLLTRQSAP